MTTDLIKYKIDLIKTRINLMSIAVLFYIDKFH